MTSGKPAGAGGTTASTATGYADVVADGRPFATLEHLADAVARDGGVGVRGRDGDCGGVEPAGAWPAPSAGCAAASAPPEWDRARVRAAAWSGRWAGVRRFVYELIARGAVANPGRDAL
ncbi:hypothetical protein [Streptomyces sp. HPF1205]|uniref:hypothetical protein n=1 Tax=Streptomyces sp. HPF1205 TaxID=2873262 RepID=UPI001CEC601C|nr:hypothetical protein [Streptomyces sp. HPF1205]